MWIYRAHSLCRNTLLLDAKMVFFLFGRFLIHFGGSIPYLFLPTLMIQNNFSLSQAATALSMAAFTNTISRLAICAITDHPKAPNGMTTTTISLLLSGAIMVCIPFSYEYYMYAILGMSYGFFCAPVASLLSIVINEIAPLKELNYWFGAVSFVQGIGTFIGPPFAGLLVDGFSKTDSTYGLMVAYVGGGACMICSGLFCFMSASWNKTNCS